MLISRARSSGVTYFVAAGRAADTSSNFTSRVVGTGAVSVRTQRKIIAQSYSIPIYVLLYNIVAASGAEGVSIDAHGFPEFHGAWLSA